MIAPTNKYKLKSRDEINLAKLVRTLSHQSTSREIEDENNTHNTVIVDDNDLESSE